MEYVLKLDNISLDDYILGIADGDTKYLEKLDRLNVSYIVYHFNNEKEMLVEECRNDGEYHKEKRLFYKVFFHLFEK